MSSGCLPEVKSDRKFLNCQPKKWSWSLVTDLVNTKLKQWIVFFACSDWLLKLGICGAIHLQAKPNSCKLPKNGTRFAATTNKEISQINEAVAEKHEEGNKNCFGSFYG